MRLSPAACALFAMVSTGALAQDVQMNQPDDFGTRGNNTAQSETNHAVTANGILAAWNDSSQIAALGVAALTSLVGWRYSPDAGASFIGGGFFTIPDGICLTDPAIVADGAGFFYLAAMASPSPNDKNKKNLSVARSTGNTAPFGFDRAVTLEPMRSNGILDKELMAIDRTGGPYNNRIYISATDLTQGVVVAHSTRLSPLGFSPWQLLSSSSTGSMPAVAPNGDVYVIWTAKLREIQIAKSTDGGNTFTPAKTIASFIKTPDLLAPEGTFKAEPFAQIAVDSTAAGSPTRGNVYVVYAADPDGGISRPDNCDIYFMRSTNGGTTWTAPRAITSGLAVTLGRDRTTNDSWLPSIAVSPVNGHIYVTFYDRRDDPENTEARVFRALSTDGGLTWANAPFGASAFVPIMGFPTVLGEDGTRSYWGDYNWSTADAAGLHFTWGDSHNPCNPPAAAPSPCKPRGRPDLDAYYRKTANLSGADLFIQPWGAVTGIGPMWQTPDIFVVDAGGNAVNARLGIVNHLRARVRNLGNAAASGAVVRFSYAPWLAGINDSLFKEIGTVALDFSAAGGAADTQLAALDWDLTGTSDTNGGSWPAPIGFFQHVCIKVSVELAGDVNLSNNAAQSNFADVVSTPSGTPLHFLIAGPGYGKAPLPARLAVSALPPGFRVNLSFARGLGDPQGGFLLKPQEILLARVSFVVAKPSLPEGDVVADISLLLDGKPAGGISARLVRSSALQKDLRGIGPVTSAYWVVKPPEKPPDQPSTPGFERPLPPPRVIPEGVKIRRTYAGGYEKAFRAAKASFKEQDGPAVANRE